MKDQLLLLIEVQRHDARIQELESMRKAGPEKLANLEEDLRKVEALLARERTQLEETEAWRRQQELAMKDEEAAIQRAKQRANQVKNMKEAMANERELEATRRTAKEREEEVLKLATAVEAAKQSIAQHEGDLEALRKVVEEERQKVQAESARFEGEIGDERQKREEAAARVRPDVLKKYSTIRMRRGLALVPVKNGTCQGCNMNIPPQVYNTLQRGDTVELCGSCHRIIYWDKLLENPDGRPAEPPAGKSE